MEFYVVEYYWSPSWIRLADGLKVSPTSIYYTYVATVHHHPFRYLLFDTESWIGGPVATILFYIESYSTFYSTLIFHDCPYLPIVRVYSHYTYTDFLCYNIGDLRREDCFGFTFG